jgi:hypothetical protein
MPMQKFIFKATFQILYSVHFNVASVWKHLHISQLIWSSVACGSFFLIRKLLNEGLLMAKLKSLIFTTVTVTKYLTQITADMFPCCGDNLFLSYFITFHHILINSNTSGVATGAGILYPSGTHWLPWFFSWIFILCCVFLIINCLSFVFSLGHCINCPSSIYGFWLSLCYHQFFSSINFNCIMQNVMHVKCRSNSLLTHRYISEI